MMNSICNAYGVPHDKIRFNPSFGPIRFPFAGFGNNDRYSADVAARFLSIRSRLLRAAPRVPCAVNQVHTDRTESLPRRAPSTYNFSQ